MKTTDSILTILSRDNATIGALADQLQQPARVITAFCADLELAGLATSFRLVPEIVAWQLTEAGRQAAASLTPAT
jgi:hypothetical protein